VRRFLDIIKQGTENAEKKDYLQNDLQQNDF